MAKENYASVMVIYLKENFFMGRSLEKDNLMGKMGIGLLKDFGGIMHWYIKYNENYCYLKILYYFIV